MENNKARGPYEPRDLLALASFSGPAGTYEKGAVFRVRTWEQEDDLLQGKSTGGVPLAKPATKAEIKTAEANKEV